MFVKLFCLFFVVFPSESVRVYLRPAEGGTSNVYDLINAVWGVGATSEVPDCSHPTFGPHIYQGHDEQLNKQVFFFASHVTPDDDRCRNFDRQRNEIRPDRGELVGVDGDTQSFSWIFKIDEGFRPSWSFTHLFQIKAQGGDDAQPLITISPRAGNQALPGDRIEILYINSAHQTTILQAIPLAYFEKTWIKVKISATYGLEGVGRFTCDISEYLGGRPLMSYSGDLQMWRNGDNYYRGKWGIYRSLNNINQLRDEIVRFDNICIATGTPECT